MYYKLTTQEVTTHGGFTWEDGKWYRIPDADRGQGICSKSYFHCYDDPLLAIFLNPAHADIHNPRLWHVNVEGHRVTERGLKFGFTMMRLAAELPVPQVTVEQRIAFAILCARQAENVEYARPEATPRARQIWNRWAENWLNDANRSQWAAFQQYRHSVSLAHRWAAQAAGGRANVPQQACEWAASAAVCAAEHNHAIDLKDLARNAMQY